MTSSYPVQPMVSCLMATRPGEERYKHVVSSIAAYCRQNWPHRELVIVQNGGDRAGRDRLAAHVAGLGRDDIRLISVPDRFVLGEVRNASVEAARGEVLCQWDDDDLYHPDRLSLQWGAMRENDACAVCLQDVFQYFPEVGRLFWTSWAKTEAGGHPGTIMMIKSVAPVYPTVGEQASLGEDLAVLLSLKARHRVHMIERAPWIFIYVSHGKNSWNSGHHAMLADKLSISRGLLARREQLIRENLRPLGLPSTTTLWGSNGEAFVLGKTSGVSST